MELRRVVVVPNPRAASADATLRAATSAFGPERAELRIELGALGAPTEPAVRIDAHQWASEALDPFEVDVAVSAAIDRGADALVVDASRASLPATSRALREIAIRYQRLFPRRNEASRAVVFDGVVARHRAAHDLSKPLVRADFDHARDVWQWVLRLSPGAGLAVQVAALFHDVERLVSEADARVEHHAPDYQAFKDAHARGSGALLRAILGEVLEAACLDRVAALVERHERRGGDADAELLGDADALSFFSVNVCGFLRYYGEPHTRTKVAWTLSRLSPRGRAALRSIRMREDVRALVESASSRLDASPIGRADIA